MSTTAALALGDRGSRAFSPRRTSGCDPYILEFAERQYFAAAPCTSAVTLWVATGVVVVVVSVMDKRNC
jgi:hypothetical protein